MDSHVSLQSLQSRLEGCVRELTEIKSSIARSEVENMDGHVKVKAKFLPFNGYEEANKLQRNMLASRTRVYDENEALRARLGPLVRRRHELEVLSEELKASIRRVKSATALKCATSDVVEYNDNYSKDKLAFLLSKGCFRQIETKCRVLIEVDRENLQLRVVGTQESILLASAEINSVFEKYSEEIYISDETIVCLVINKASLLQSIQTECNVRVDISRAKGSCKFYGSFDNVKAAISAVKQYRSKKAEIAFNEDMLGFLLGKGDCFLRQIETNRIVQIEIYKESNRIAVIGHAEGVVASAHDVQKLLEENIEVEEELLVGRKFVVDHILANGGAFGRKMQRDLNVTLSAIGWDDENLPDLQLIIRGGRQGVKLAKEDLETLHNNFCEQNFEISLSDAIAALLVGKKGGRIQSLRLKYPSASIDLDDNILRVRCEDVESRKAIKEFVESIIKENFILEFEVSGDMQTILKSSRGRQIRDHIRELKVTCDFDAGESKVLLRGTEPNVLSIASEIEKFSRANYQETVELDNEDRIFIQVPFDTEDSVEDILESEFNVELSVNRKENRVIVIGRKENVADALSALRATLEGSVQRGTAVIKMEPFVIPYLIGKEGSNSKRFEREHNVKLNFNTATNVVRIRLNPTLTGATSLDRMTKLLFSAKSALEFEARLAPISKVVSIDSRFVTKGAIDMDLWAALQSAAEEHGITVTSALKTKVCLSGPSEAVDTVYEELMQLQNGVVTAVVRLSENLTIGDTDLTATLRDAITTLSLDSALAATVAVSPSQSQLEIVGPLNKMAASKAILYDMLSQQLPSHFQSYPISSDLVNGFCCYKIQRFAENVSGAVVDIDSKSCCMRVNGLPNSVLRAMQIVDKEFTDLRDRYEFIEINSDLSRELLSTYASVICDFENEMQIKITVKLTQLVIEGEDQLTTFIARSRIEEWLQSIQPLTREFAIPVNSVGAFIGKGGTHIRQLRTETGATIEFNSETLAVKISGSPACIDIAAARVEEFLASEIAKRFTCSLPIPSSKLHLLPSRLPKEVSEYCLSLGLRVELDRAKSELILKGSPEKCPQAMKALQSFCDTGDFTIIGESKREERMDNDEIFPPKEDSNKIESVKEDNQGNGKFVVTALSMAERLRVRHGLAGSQRVEPADGESMESGAAEGKALVDSFACASTDSATSSSSSDDNVTSTHATNVSSHKSSSSSSSNSNKSNPSSDASASKTAYYKSKKGVAIRL